MQPSATLIFRRLLQPAKVSFLSLPSSEGTYALLTALSWKAPTPASPTLRRPSFSVTVFSFRQPAKAPSPSSRRLSGAVKLFSAVPVNAWLPILSSLLVC